MRGLQLTATDEPGFWEINGHHNYGGPWQEQRYWGDRVSTSYLVALALDGTRQHAYLLRSGHPYAPQPPVDRLVRLLPTKRRRRLIQQAIPATGRSAQIVRRERLRIEPPVAPSMPGGWVFGTPKRLTSRHRPLPRSEASFALVVPCAPRQAA